MMRAQQYSLRLFTLPFFILWEWDIKIFFTITFTERNICFVHLVKNTVIMEVGKHAFLTGLSLHTAYDRRRRAPETPRTHVLSSLNCCWCCVRKNGSSLGVGSPREVPDGGAPGGGISPRKTSEDRPTMLIRNAWATNVCVTLSQRLNDKDDVSFPLVPLFLWNTLLRLH